jgi:hypothetical protein
MSYTTSKKLNALGSQMMVYYKGTGLQYPKKMFPVVLAQAKLSNFQEMMTDEEMLEQLDVMEQAICSTHTNSGGNPENVFKKALPDEDAQDCLVIWFLNVVCLIQRGALKNDNNNGYLFFNIK